MDDHTAIFLELALKAMERAAPGSAADFLKLLSDEAALDLARSRFAGDDCQARDSLAQLAMRTARIVTPPAND